MVGRGKGKEKRKKKKEEKEKKNEKEASEEERERERDERKMDVRDCFGLKSRIYSISIFRSKISFLIVLRQNFNF